MEFTELSKTIKKYRKLNKLSQTELGKKLYMDQSQISRLENSPSSIDIGLLPDIAKALNIDSEVIEKAYYKDVRNNSKNESLICMDINIELEKIFNLLEKEDIITEKNKWTENIEKTYEKINFLKNVIENLDSSKNNLCLSDFKIKELLLKFIRTSQKFYLTNEDIDITTEKISEFMIDFKAFNDEFLILEYLIKKELDSSNKIIIDFTKILIYSNFLDNKAILYHNEIINQSTNKQFKNIISVPYCFLINDKELFKFDLEKFKIYLTIIYTINDSLNKNKSYLSAINKNELFYEFFNDLDKINLKEYENNERIINSILNLDFIKNKNITKNDIDKIFLSLKQLKDLITKK